MFVENIAKTVWVWWIVCLSVSVINTLNTLLEVACENEIMENIIAADLYATAF